MRKQTHEQRSSGTSKHAPKHTHTHMHIHPGLWEQLWQVLDCSRHGEGHPATFDVHALDADRHILADLALGVGVVHKAVPDPGDVHQALGPLPVFLYLDEKAVGHDAHDLAVNEHTGVDVHEGTNVACLPASRPSFEHGEAQLAILHLCHPKVHNVVDLDAEPWRLQLHLLLLACVARVVALVPRDRVGAILVDKVHGGRVPLLFLSV
mmetsp:Transcript_84830/g.262620  ORF Transcript_84830/g.262620 Transcript_84830/m.262620 type:complete len:208 (-) Transcript_84830:598-1221(-)